MGGAVTVLAVFPLIPQRLRLSLRRRWSARLLSALGLQLKVEGKLPPRGSLLVANHVSWVDIFALNALAPAAFVSKAEVRHWPLVGWLAARNDTVFLRRGSRGHARIVNGQIIDLLKRGMIVALFPEGTTTDGGTVLHFHGALLQPAIDAGAPIVPVVIRYLDHTSQRTSLAAYVGETSLMESLRSIVSAHGLRATIEPLPAIEVCDIPRKELARRARGEIEVRIRHPASEPVPASGDGDPVSARANSVAAAGRGA